MHPLPARPGPRPATTPGLPHSQLTQQPADASLRDALAARVFALPAVVERASQVSVPGARALVLEPAAAAGPPAAFFAGRAEREFAHLHPGDDHSLHLCLPAALAADACRAGWAEPHPLVATGELPPTVLMVYAPRDARELDVVAGLVAAAHRFATGTAGREQPMPITGFRHVGLTVTDLERSARWYHDVLGFEERFRETTPERQSVIMALPGAPALVGLVHFPGGANDAFSPLRTGLDHLCLAVPTRDDLEVWAARLDALGVTRSAIEEAATSPMLNFKDPDGIALTLALPLTSAPAPAPAAGAGAAEGSPA